MRQDDPLMEAAKKGDLETIKKILINVKNDKNKAFFILYYAVCCGYCHVLDWLKEQGCDMHVKFKGGLSALHLASGRGQISVLDWYAKNGADLNQQDERQYTPIHCAAEWGQLKVLDWFKARGWDMKAQTRRLGSGLHVAAQKGQIAVLEWYLKEGADLAERDEEGWMLVHCAAQYGQVKVLDWLEAKGCDMQAEDNANWDLVTYAIEWDEFEVLDWTKAKGYHLLLEQNICAYEALDWFKDQGYDMLPPNEYENPFQVALSQGADGVVDWYCRNAFDFGFQTLIEQFWNSRSSMEEFHTDVREDFEELLESHLKNNPRVLLYVDDKFKQSSEEDLNTCLEKAKEIFSPSFCESLRARINLTKAYQTQNLDCFLAILSESCEGVFFKADIQAYMENRNELLGNIIDTLLGFLLKHYQLSGPQYFLGEFARHFHDDYRAGGLENFLNEREINSLKISTLCLLTQDFSNSNNQSLYCANLSFLIKLKITGEVCGFTLTDLIQNYPDEIISILDELKDLYEELIERELNVLEPSLFASQMNLALREKLRKVEEENQVLRDELNEFRKRRRNEEPDNNPLDAKKMNDSSPRLSPGPEFFSSESRKREREEEPGANQESEGEARLNENPQG